MTKKPQKPKPEAEADPVILEAEAVELEQGTTVEGEAKPWRRPKPSVEFAYRVWKACGRPPTRALEQILASRGYSIDHTSLSRWMHSYGPWIEAQTEEQPLPLDRVIAALAHARQGGDQIAPDVYLGIKAQLLARLWESAQNIEIRDFTEWHKAGDAFERLASWIHAERGKAIESGDELVAFPKPTSLMAQLNPTVTVAPFKKPNGGSH